MSRNAKEQKREIQRESPELVARTRDKWVAEIRAKPDLTLADRLTLAGMDQRITLKVSGVTIEARAPFAAEIEEIKKASLSGDSGKIIDLLDYFCIDRSLNKEFWSSGRFTITQLKDILMQIVGTSAEEQERLRSFREKRSGSEPSGNLP